MNILCPNCQKMLTVPDECAGRSMRCQLCNGAFTVPSLPGVASPPLFAATPEPDIYPIRPEPPPSAPSPLAYSPSPSPEAAAVPPPSPQRTTKRDDFQRTLVFSLSPTVLPWIAPVCLLLVFFLQFFDWVGLYPGGEPAEVGNAWRIAFGVYAIDGDLKNLVPFVEDEKYKPGVSVLTLFYLLLFFPALAVTVASVVIPLVPTKLPPQVTELLPWRWAITAAANLILFLFLGLQLLLGFSLDSRYQEWVDKETKRETKSNPTTPERKLANATRGELLERLRHTVWLRLVVLLHLIAIVSSVLLFWLDQRGAHRPLPRMELKW